MAGKEGISGNRAVRAAIQKLQSLDRAGITHLAKASHSETGESTPQDSEIIMTGAPDDRDPAAALAAVAQEVADCTRCAELAQTRTQTVFGVGNPKARLVFCGEAPGADEDRQGEPFVGRAGKLLTDIIEKGMNLRREDIYILNILRCRPPGNRNPLPTEAASCREYLDRQLEIIQPEFICCLGAIAAQNLLDTTVAIGKLRGTIHNYQGVKVVCTYHPAYLLRNPAAKKTTWEDIQLLMKEMGMPIEKK
jgi:uracil-DNA glycosylase family 4